MTRWEPSDLLTDFWPVPPTDAEDALVTVSRIPWVASWGYTTETGRLWWTLKNGDGCDAAHLRIKRHVARSVSEHRAIDWEP